MSDISIPGGRIRSFVERIEHLDTELQELTMLPRQLPLPSMPSRKRSAEIAAPFAAFVDKFQLPQCRLSTID